MRDAATELVRALLRCANFANFTLEDLRTHAWASATFTGARHALSFRLEGEDAEAEADGFIDGLEEREFDLRGHVLADLALVSQSRTSGPGGPRVQIALEALTVEGA